MPQVLVQVELGPALAVLAGTTEAAELESRLAASLEADLDRLGIPGDSTVEVITADTTRPLRVRIHGALQPYPPELLLRTWIAVAPAGRHSIDTRAGSSLSPFPADWLGAFAEELASGVDGSGLDLLATFVERTVEHVLLERPACVLGPRQVAEYHNQALPISPEELGQILRRLLDLGVPVADRALLRDLIREGAEIDRPLEDTIEAAFTELRSHQVAIHVHPVTLGELLPGVPVDEPLSVYSTDIDERLRNLFWDMETTFVSTFGFVLPDLVWVPSPALPTRTVAIEIEGWWGLPMPMLGQGQRLVNAPVEHEALEGISAWPAVHPYTGVRCAVVGAETSREELEDVRRLETWGSIDFVILHVLGELSQRPGRLFGLEELEYQLASVAAKRRGGTVATPVEAALARYTLGDLTRVRRSLIEERLSLRSLPLLLEALLSYDALTPRDARLMKIDERRPAPTNGNGSQTSLSHYEFVRRRLKPYIRQKHAEGNEVSAYRLDPALEERVLPRAGTCLSDEDRELLRVKVWKTLRASVDSSASVVVTTTGARPHVRALLAPELPTLPVIAEHELGTDVDILTVTEIA